MADIVMAYTVLYSCGLYSYGLYGYGRDLVREHTPPVPVAASLRPRHSYGLHTSSYGLYSYGLCCCGLYSYGLYSYGP